MSAQSIGDSPRRERQWGDAVDTRSRCNVVGAGPGVEERGEGGESEGGDRDANWEMEGASQADRGRECGE